MGDARQIDMLLPQPQSQLADAADLTELAEHQRQRLANPQVRVLFQTIVSTAPEAYRDGRVQVAARCLQAQRLLRPLAENRQLELAECSLQAEQQSVVDQPRIVDPVLINNPAVHEGAKFQQGVPVTTVACQTRGLDRQYRAGGTGANRREQTFETGPRLSAA